MIERRAEVRLLCADLVEVEWKDKTGHTRKSVANLEDISRCGVCVQLDDPIPVDTPVTVRHAKMRLRGNVRYCLFRETGYFIGVQLAPDSRWSPSQYRPRHLLDPRRLVIRAVKRALKSTPVQ
ncbi:MAG: hypothetical protein RMK57_02760 [Bryobacterales bacterium]|nr:hypothetical protein [Bryobacteraceae bacterium]MDW8353429.1 hypothetical protein [Bryobacterales bacterium]